MDKNSAQTVVKVVSVLYWIGAVLSVLFGLMMLVGGSALGMFAGGLGGGILGGFAVLMGILMIIFAILGAIVGYGLWTHRSWARILGIVLSIIGLLSFPVGTIINAIIIYFLAFNKDVKMLFN